VLDGGRGIAIDRPHATFRAAKGAAAYGDRPYAKTGRLDSRPQISARRSADDQALYEAHGTKMGLGRPSMPKRNRGNRGLPARWRHYHRAYYYRVPPGLESQWDGHKQFRLGTTLAESATEWAKRMRTAERPAIYIKQLLDRYSIEVIPTKAAATQRGDNLALVNLRKVFGDMRLEDLEPRHIYRYVDTRLNKQGQKSPATGVHEARVFKHAFTKAVEWGFIPRHPFKGEVRLKGARPRSRYIEDWEIIEALSLVPKRKSGSVLMLQAYIRVKLLIGIRRGDMLRSQANSV